MESIDDKKLPSHIGYIVFDGLDGCGKGTQIQLLSERFEKEGMKCIFTREPGGAPLAEKIRTLLLESYTSTLTEFLLFWAARRNHLEEVVWPMFEKKIPVFSDRGDSSTLAYQIYGRNSSELESEFWRMRELIYSGRNPTCYIFLEISPEVARQRANLRGDSTHFDAQKLDFYERVHEGFRVFSQHPKVKMVSVDATRSREEIHEDIYRIVCGELGWKK